MKMTLKDGLAAASVPVIWGFGFTMAKAGIEEFPPLFLMSLRFGVTAIAMCWFFPPPKGQFKALALTALVSATAQYGFTFTGLKGLDVSTGVLLVQLEVPFAAVLATIFLKDVLGWPRALGMAGSFVGVAFIVGAPSLRGDLFSAGLLVFGALTWAVGQLMIKQMLTVTGFQLIAWMAVMAAPQMFVASLLFETDHWQSLQNATVVGWGTVLYMGLIMTGLGYGLWYYVLKKYDVNQAMPFMLLTPVSSIIAAVLFLGERPDLRTLFGGLLVIGGVGLVVMFGQRRAAAQEALATGSAIEEPVNR